VADRQALIEVILLPESIDSLTVLRGGLQSIRRDLQQLSALCDDGPRHQRPLKAFLLVGADERQGRAGTACLANVRARVRAARLANRSSRSSWQA